jgi:RNA polymerase sigma factor (sigma-70 family)
MTVEEFNQALDLYSDKLKRFVEKVTMDNVLAEDIVQDTYETAWNNRENIQSINVKSYLFYLAYHILRSHKRTEKRRNTMSGIDLDEQSHSQQYSDASEILLYAVDQLDPIQKTAIILRDYEGFGYDEIGQMIGEAKSQVKMHIFRGRVALQKYLVKPDNVI